MEHKQHRGSISHPRIPRRLLSSMTDLIWDRKLIKHPCRYKQKHNDCHDKIRSWQSCINYSKKDILTTTNKARIPIKDIVYKKQEKTVYIPLLLLEKIPKKRTGLSRLFEPQEFSIKKSLAIIKNIEKFDVINNCDVGENEITLLFGITIKNHEIYLSSVQESRGVLSFEMKILVKDIDISIIQAENAPEVST